MNRVLFITYYWPPSGKASLHWPLKMIQYLPEFDWMPSVLTVKEDTFSHKDETFLEEIDPGLKIVKTASLEPFNLYRQFMGKKKGEPLIASETISKHNKSLNHRLSVWIRMNLFVPDARVGWYFPAVKEGKSFLSEEKFDAIISIGPPHTAHLIGKKLSSSFKIPHLPVFIDPWTNIIYYKDFKRSKPTIQLDNYLEKNVLKNAKQIIFVTETMMNDYIKKYDWIKEKSHVLYWGYNEEGFKEIKPVPTDYSEEVIVHAGNIFDYQNPVNFLRNIKDEINKGRKLRIKFIGSVSPGIMKTIEEAGLKNFTEYLGFLPYNDMLNELMKASYLMVCASEPRHVPGKLFEYLRTGKPIIAFGDYNKEVKKILEETNAGMLFHYDEDAYRFFEKAKNFKTDLEIIKKFDRKNIAKGLAEILKD